MVFVSSIERHQGLVRRNLSPKTESEAALAGKDFDRIAENLLHYMSHVANRNKPVIANKEFMGGLRAITAECSPEGKSLFAVLSASQQRRLYSILFTAGKAGRAEYARRNRNNH